MWRTRLLDSQEGLRNHLTKPTIVLSNNVLVFHVGGTRERNKQCSSYCKIIDTVRTNEVYACFVEKTGFHFGFLFSWPAWIFDFVRKVYFCFVNEFHFCYFTMDDVFVYHAKISDCFQMRCYATFVAGNWCQGIQRGSLNGNQDRTMGIVNGKIELFSLTVFSLFLYLELHYSPCSTWRACYELLTWLKLVTISTGLQAVHEVNPERNL